MTAVDTPLAGPVLLDVQAVAVLLTCSRRNIYRLSDSGAMPRPVKLGRLTRWRREDIERWVRAGCGDCRTEEAAP